MKTVKNKRSRTYKKEPGLIIRIEQNNQTEEEKRLERARFFAWLAKVSLESVPQEHRSFDNIKQGVVQ